MSLIPNISEADSEGSVTSKGNYRFFRGQKGKEYEASRCSDLSLPDSSTAGRERDIHLTEFTQLYSSRHLRDIQLILGTD